MPLRFEKKLSKMITYIYNLHFTAIVKLRKWYIFKPLMDKYICFALMVVSPYYFKGPSQLDATGPLFSLPIVNIIL